mmetsp:Transcript_76455/g.163971  ORF Transcript_76455/g.163971 Transcript_76455/m.163971 type:complete len:229 (+) Transcript_76455:50-736(+)
MGAMAAKVFTCAELRAMTDPKPVDNVTCAYAEINRMLREIDTMSSKLAGRMMSAPVADFCVDVCLMTNGAKVATGVPCMKTDLVMALKGVLREMCGETSPFQLFHRGQLLHNRNMLGSVPEGSTLQLLRIPLLAVGERLVGPKGAAARGDLAAVRDLLDEGVDANWRDEVRLRTALMWAAAAGQEEVAKLLLAHGANPELRALGARADDIAAANGHDGLAVLLHPREP